MNQRSIQFLIFMAFCFSLPSCSNGDALKEPAKPQLTERVVRLMGGWPHTKAITETGKATAYRIQLNRENNYKEEIISEGIELNPKQRQALVGLISRDEAYEWDISKGCRPLPGVLITFEDGATYARVRFCFSCQMLQYKPSQTGWENFDPINSELIKWVKGIFPDDQAIQSLGTDEEALNL